MSAKVQMHTFFVRLDQAGQLPSKIDAALAEATRELVGGNIRGAMRLVSEAHTAAAQMGAALAHLEAWGKSIPASAEIDDAPQQPQQPQPDLRPGQEYADAGAPTTDVDGVYRGTVDGRSMTLGNWAFYANHALGNRAGEIFSGPFVIGDPSRPGHTYTPGDLANAQEDSQVPGGPNLADFLA